MLLLRLPHTFSIGDVLVLSSFEQTVGVTQPKSQREYTTSKELLYSAVLKSPRHVFTCCIYMRKHIEIEHIRKKRVCTIPKSLKVNICWEHHDSSLFSCNFFK